MSRRFLSVMASIVLVAATAFLAARHETPLLAQAAAGEGGAAAQGRGARGGPPAPQTAQTAATTDLTGYWVRMVTEDWRWLMAVPPKGNADSIPLNAAGRTILDAWDPAKDEAEGNQCKGYGAGAISRLPTRAHVTWQDASTLKWETDQGVQTRLFRFGPAAQEAENNPGPRSWQGLSIATWEPAAGGRGGGRGGGPVGPPAAPDADGNPAPVPGNAPPAVGRGNAQNGWLKVVTTNLKPGYLRKNGLPYSEKATVTEYFQPTPETYGVRYMIVTTIVEDPEYLMGPLITSSNYRKLPDTNNGWDPQPCSVR
jgi:hypothetical protein